MYGYLRPDKEDLRVREFALFRAAYCGVCRAIRLDYGQIPRFTLSYDSAVLAVLLAGASGGEPKAVRRRCVLHPFFRRPMLEGHGAFGYTAAVSVMLARQKLKDAWHDEKRVVALPGSAALALADRKARAKYPGAAQAIDSAIAELGKLEKARCAELDLPADAMGRMMRGIVEAFPSLPKEAAVLIEPLGYQWGRWVYLIDALDDRAKDAKSGAYNAVNAMGQEPGAVEVAKKACLFAQDQAQALFDLTNFAWGREIVENVLYRGMPLSFGKLSKENHTDG